MSRHKTPRRLGDVLEELVNDLGLRDRIDAAAIVETWAELAGQEINAVTKRAWVERDKLYVQITNASWRQELHFKRSEWRRKLNEKLGRELVKELHFR